MKIVIVTDSHIFEGLVIDSEYCPNCGRVLCISGVEVVLVGRAAAYPYRLSECPECSEYYYLPLPAEEENGRENS